MLRALFHLRKTKTENSGDADPGAAATGEHSEYHFKGNYRWGYFRLDLMVESGIIKDAAAVSEQADPQLMEMIGVYLESRKFERKEVLQILDMVPVKDEDENEIMRDVYNLVDAQITE